LVQKSFGTNAQGAEIRNNKNRPDIEVTEKMMIEFSTWELEAALGACDANSACGPDGISNKDLISMPHSGKDALLRKFNELLRCGVWPDEWKCGEGIPLHKPGKDKKEINSYRIIVKSSHLGKTLERMCLRRLQCLIEEKRIFTDEMAAYRPLRSPQDCILEICTDVE